MDAGRRRGRSIASHRRTGAQACRFRLSCAASPASSRHADATTHLQPSSAGGLCRSSRRPLHRPAPRSGPSVAGRRNVRRRRRCALVVQRRSPHPHAPAPTATSTTTATPMDHHARDRRGTVGSPRRERRAGRRRRATSRRGARPPAARSPQPGRPHRPRTGPDGSADTPARESCSRSARCAHRRLRSAPEWRRRQISEPHPLESTEGDRIRSRAVTRSVPATALALLTATCAAHRSLVSMPSPHRVSTNPSASTSPPSPSTRGRPVTHAPRPGDQRPRSGDRVGTSGAVGVAWRTEMHPTCGPRERHAEVGARPC